MKHLDQGAPKRNISSDKVRHYCRNPHCGGKLKEPAEILRAAFCCRGCHDTFYRRRCLVCEHRIEKATANQKLCRRPWCRRDYRQNPVKYASPWGGSQPVQADVRNADKLGTFWCDKSGRGWS